MESRELKTSELIDIGKKAYEEFLSSSGSPKVLSDIANNYSIPTYEIFRAIRFYRKRVLDPKPTKEQEDDYLFYVSNDPNLYKYDHTIDKLTQSKSNFQVKDIISATGLDEIKQIIKSANLSEFAPSQIEELKRNGAESAISTEQIIAIIINKYIESEVTSPESIVLQYGFTDITDFNHKLTRYKKQSEEHMANYLLFEDTLKKRLDSFIDKIKLYEQEAQKSLVVKKIRLTTLDLEQIVGLSLKEIDECLRKDYVRRMLGKSYCEQFLQRITYAAASKPLTLEQAQKIVYSYKSQSLTPEAVTNIYNYLLSQGLTCCEYNIRAGFQKLVRNELNTPVVNKK